MGLQKVTGRALGTRPVTQGEQGQRLQCIRERPLRVAPFYRRRQSIELSDLSNRDKWAAPLPLGRGLGTETAIASLAGRTFSHWWR